MDMDYVSKFIAENKELVIATIATMASTQLPVKETIRDLTEPSVKEVGRFFGRVCSLPNFALDGGTFLLNSAKAKIEDIFKRANKKLDDINYDESQTEKIKPDLLFSIMKNAQYILNEEKLKELFAELLVSAVVDEKNTHPLYSHIITQINGFDAILFEKIYNHRMMPIIVLYCEFNNMQISKITMPIILNREFEKEYDKYNFFDLMNSIELLQRIGLIEIDYNIISISEQSREDFSDYIKSFDDIINNLTENGSTKYKFLEKNGILSMTHLGENFGKITIQNRW